MKRKNIFGWAVATIALFMSGITNAQIQEKQQLLNFGLGLGSNYSVSGFKTTMPPLEASYEVMIKEKISVGGFIGMSSFKSEFNIGTLSSTTKYNYFNIGALANYHFVNDVTWNVYVGARLGYTSSSVKDESNYDFEEFLESKNTDVKSSGFLIATNVGARYHLSEKLALYSELGYGITIFRVGVSLKL